jgi:Xaa-Pro aminopeptidase
MCDKKTRSIVRAQQAPIQRVAEFLTTAERELAAFYEVVFRRYGLKEASYFAITSTGGRSGALRGCCGPTWRP